MVEGGKRPFIKDRKEAIQEGGEGHFMAHLAGNKNISIDSPEPNEKLERKKLLKEFSKEDVQLYYFSRIVYQWNCLTKKIDFEQYTNDFLNDDKKKSGWKSFDFSLLHMIEIFESRLNRKFKKSDKSFFYSINNPHYTNAITNQISKRSGGIRDNTIVKNIVKLWKSGKSIFIVYGSGHIPVFREKLENMLGR